MAILITRCMILLRAGDHNFPSGESPFYILHK
jgi:hypothetical protein